MARESVLREILNQDETLPNSSLLKKYILCLHYGWFRINGLSPDENFSLADYLFDDERIVFDFTRLNEQNRNLFFNWFLTPHFEDAHRAFLSGVATNDYRGYTAEVGLSWWGRITNLLFYKKKSYQWDLAPLELTLDYQLNGIEICEGENGLLIGLNQFAIENKGNKYHQSDDLQEKPLRNTKRLVLTNEMVQKIILTTPETINYEAMLNTPHPYSIHINLPNKRLKAMHEYRQTQRFLAIAPWYIRIWRWIKSCFAKSINEFELHELRSGYKNYRPLINKDNVQVFQRPKNGEVLIIEKRPELDSMVFCGGGAKVYAHVGAYKAFEEAGIKPSKFAGSSAGAIMAILCYLGYSSHEIRQFFQKFNQDNLVHYDIDSSGISDTSAMKAALDYMITKKVNQIVKQYGVEETQEGKRFLANSVLKSGKITFESLQALKTRYPECSLGDKLVITGTNIDKKITRYFSYAQTPRMEVSEAGTISASLPVVFKPIIFEGETHNDGGILSNLPTEAFSDDHSTFLESDHGNCLSLVAFQFDNGYERDILDRLVHRVYRENFFLNWIYGFLTGVKDPVSGWERDRLKLLQHSNQVVLIPVGDVSTTQFNIEPNAQNTLFEKGYQAAKNYIDTRYEKNQTNTKNTNQELLYSTFSSLAEALYYCCYRGNKEWFERLAEKAIEQDMDEEKLNYLRQVHFNDIPANQTNNHNGLDKNTNFTNQLSAVVEKRLMTKNMQLFEAIYPAFLKLPLTLVKHPQDLKCYRLARHSFSLSNPLACLTYLEKIKGDRHILLTIFIQLLENYKTSMTDIDKLCKNLEILEKLFPANFDLYQPGFFGKLRLLPRHLTRILNDLKNGQWQDVLELYDALKQNQEPLQMMNFKATLNNEEPEVVQDNYTPRT